MKKVIGILSIILFGYTAGFAQKSFTVGLRAGVNLSQVKGDGKGSDQSYWETEGARTTGFTGGLFTRFGDKIFIQPEFIVSQKGGTTKDLLGVERDFKQVYFDVPVLVGVRVAKVMRLNVGPVASFLVNKDKNFLETIGFQTEEKGFRSAVLGYQAGVGFDIGKINIDMRYEGNINDVFDIDYDNAQTESQFRGKGNLWFITAGINF